MEPKRLYRSRDEKMLGGVCGGLAEYLNLDPSIVRLIFVVMFFAGCSGFLVYLIMWIITPLEPETANKTVNVSAKEYAGKLTSGTSKSTKKPTAKENKE